MANRDLFTRIRKRPAAMVAAGALMASGLVVATTAAAEDVGGYNIAEGVDKDAMLDSGVTNLPDPESNIKELGPVNGNDTKLVVIHDAAVPMLADTNPNAQVDLRDIWLGTRTHSDGDQYLYFAWERDSANGSGVLMIEFQQAALGAECDYTTDTGDPNPDFDPDACNPWSGRQANDFILVWDQQGQDITILKRVFTDVDEDGVLELTEGTKVTATAAVSTDGFFGEAAVNLTQEIFSGANKCTTLANVIPGTVTGNSDTADYKDTVLAEAPPISNCGFVKITKKTEPAGEDGTFGWNLARTNDDPIHYEGDGYSGADLTLEEGNLVVSSAVPEPTTDPTISKLIGGDNYTLTEDGPSSPFDLQSITCTPEGGTAGDAVDLTEGGTFSVEVGKTTDCVIVNELLDGTLRVIKQLTNDNNGQMALKDFDFTRDDGSGPVSESFKGDELNGTDTQDFTYPAYTTVDVVETDYSPAYATTYSDDYAGNDAAEGEDPSECLGLVVPPDGMVTCTITNDDQQGTLVVKKVVENNFGQSGTAGDFTFKVNGGGDKTFTEDASDDSKGEWSQKVDAGTYSVVENTPPDGYSDSYSDDYAGNDAGDECLLMEIGLGETVTCTITNRDSQNSPGLGQTVQSWLLRDSFSLTGIRPGADDQNDAYVTFRLFKSWDGSSTVCTDQEGEAITVYASASDYSTDGNFVRLDLAMADSQGIEVFDSGDYYWTAEYSGDAYNIGSTTLCGDEKTLIQAKDQFIEETEPSVVYRDDFTP